MKKRSMKDMLSALGGSEGSMPETAAKSNAAETVGRALLDRLGRITDMSEEELVKLILKAWEEADAKVPAEKTKLPEKLGTGSDAPLSRGKAMPKLPKPMRSGASETPAIDYSELTSEQFKELKKMLAKAQSDGRKVRL